MFSSYITWYYILLRTFEHTSISLRAYEYFPAGTKLRTLHVPLPSRRRQAKVAAAIADKDVGVLVNNVGVSYPFPKYFDELTDEEVSTVVCAIAVGSPLLCGYVPSELTRTI